MQVDPEAPASEAPTAVQPRHVTSLDQDADNNAAVVAPEDSESDSDDESVDEDVMMTIRGIDGSAVNLVPAESRFTIPRPNMPSVKYRSAANAVQLGIWDADLLYPMAAAIIGEHTHPVNGRPIYQVRWQLTWQDTAAFDAEKDEDNDKKRRRTKRDDFDNLPEAERLARRSAVFSNRNSLLDRIRTYVNHDTHQRLPLFYILSTLLCMYGQHSINAM
ncbi:g3567 [Coccomyxa elongata]